jgi:hypothetical protein
MKTQNDWIAVKRSIERQARRLSSQKTEKLVTLEISPRVACEFLRLANIVGAWKKLKPWQAQSALLTGAVLAMNRCAKGGAK